MSYPVMVTSTAAKKALEAPKALQSELLDLRLSKASISLEALSLELQC